MASLAPRVSAGPAAQRLVPVPLAKPWGQRDLGPWGEVLSGPRGDETIGEIHHCLGDAADPELFVKTLFTGARLSVQVHPDAAAARRLGFARGKDEAWVVLAAEPGATIGLGLKSACDAPTLRAAAIDGSIVDRMVWHACAPGDVFFAPAGTIHAIGAGVTLFEVQQNLDLTFRLHDYGRNRELHLDEALAVADLTAWTRPSPISAGNSAREVLVAGPGFVLERLRIASATVLAPVADRPVWAAIIVGNAEFDAAAAMVGEVWHLTHPVTIAGTTELLVAYPGATPLETLVRPA